MNATLIISRTLVLRDIIDLIPLVPILAPIWLSGNVYAQITKYIIDDNIVLLVYNPSCTNLLVIRFGIGVNAYEILCFDYGRRVRTAA